MSIIRLSGRRKMSEYEKLAATAEQCGLKIISDDFCCKLLAWIYMFGAERETVVYNTKLKSDILSARRRLNIFGGEIPSKELLGKLKGYIKECGDYFKPNRPQWVDEIDSRYNIKTEVGEHGKTQIKAKL